MDLKKKIIIGALIAVVVGGIGSAFTVYNTIEKYNKYIDNRREELYVHKEKYKSNQKVKLVKLDIDSRAKVIIKKSSDKNVKVDMETYDSNADYSVNMKEGVLSIKSNINDDVYDGRNLGWRFTSEDVENFLDERAIENNKIWNNSSNEKKEYNVRPTKLTIYLPEKVDFSIEGNELGLIAGEKITGEKYYNYYFNIIFEDELIKDKIICDNDIRIALDGFKSKINKLVINDPNEGALDMESFYNFKNVEVNTDKDLRFKVREDIYGNYNFSVDRIPEKLVINVKGSITRIEDDGSCTFEDEAKILAKIAEDIEDYKYDQDDYSEKSIEHIIKQNTALYKKYDLYKGNIDLDDLERQSGHIKHNEVYNRGEFTFNMKSTYPVAKVVEINVPDGGVRMNLKFNKYKYKLDAKTTDGISFKYAKDQIGKSIDEIQKIEGQKQYNDLINQNMKHLNQQYNFKVNAKFLSLVQIDDRD